MKLKLSLAVLSLLVAFGLAGCGTGSQNSQPDKQSGSNDSSQKEDTESDHATVLADAGWTVEPFRFTDENGKAFGMADLKGKIWLTNMIFTNCETVCPPMTNNLSKVQSTLQDEDMDIPIVSFSVDPKRDDEKALKDFGKKFDADFSSWHFLTGYTQKEMKKFAKASFHSALSKIANSDQFTHSTSFFLVNQSGKIMAKYDGLHPPEKRIAKDVKALQESDGAKVSTKGKAQKASSAEEKPVSVEIYVDAKQIKPGQKTTIKALVTQGDKKVNDADDVMFEIWKKGEDHHQKKKGKSQGNGVYSVANTFDSSGTYVIMSHVTAHGQHTMPKKSITVKD